MLIEKNSVDAFRKYLSFITDGEVVESKDYILGVEADGMYRFIPLNKNAEFAWSLLKLAAEQSPVLVSEIFPRMAHADKSN